jgi:intracellular sulfur oxidation DsrE/DsrF family protein
MKNFTLLILAITTSVICASVNADEKIKANEWVKGPIFTDYGPVYSVENRDIALEKGFKYKVFFNISQAAKGPSDLNRHIESVARFINMHALNGVELKDMDIAVVLKGAASRDALNHTAYQDKYLDDNPTLELIEQLHSKGVKFYICGQSLFFQKGTKKDLAPQVQLALSAMTMATVLQSQGYLLVP